MTLILCIHLLEVVFKLKNNSPNQQKDSILLKIYTLIFNGLISFQFMMKHILKDTNVEMEFVKKMNQSQIVPLIATFVRKLFQDIT